MTAPGQREGLAGCLATEAVEYLRARGREDAFEAGETIVRRGEAGRAFFVVLSGEVEVRLPGEAGGHLVLRRLGPGASFGTGSRMKERSFGGLLNPPKVSRTSVEPPL